MKRLLGYVGILVAAVLLLSACGGGGGGGNAAETTQTTGTVGPAGGTIEVTDPASPIKGAKVIVPAGALDSGESVSIGISYQDQLPGPITTNAPSAVLVSKVILLTKDRPQDFKAPVDVVIPYSDANLMPGDLPTVFYWDETYQRYVAAGVKALDLANKTITFSTAHFTPFAALALKGQASSPPSKWSIDTGFKPDEDGFYHPNMNFYDIGLGNCVGMSSYATWYYMQKKKTDGTGLYHKYRQGKPEYIDDVTARELITRAVMSISEVWTALGTVVSVLNPEVVTGTSLVTSLMLDGPQVMSFNYGSVLQFQRHAVVVYRYDVDQGKFYVYDNNFPGEEITVEWNPISGFSNYGHAGQPKYVSTSFFAHIPPSNFLTWSYFEDLYKGAEAGWTGDKFNSIAISSHTIDANNGTTVSKATADKITIIGTVSGGVRPAKYLKYQVVKVVPGQSGTIRDTKTMFLSDGGAFGFDLQNYDPGVYWIIMLATDNVVDASLFRPHTYAGLKQINLTVVESKAPKVIGSIDLPSAALNVKVVGNLAYVRDTSNGLRIVDVANPAAPAVLGAADINRPSTGKGVFVSGSYAYIGSGAFYIVDVSNKQAPVRVASAGFNADAGDLVVADGYAYIAAGRYTYEPTGLFAIADVTDPTVDKNRLVGSVEFPGGNIKAVALSGHYAYLVDIGNYKLQVVDITNPAAPVKKGEVGIPVWTSGISGIFLRGDKVFIAEPAGISIINISTPESPFAHYETATASYMRDVSVTGNIAYFLSTDRLTYYDITDPVKPVFKGGVDLPAFGTGLFISGNRAYVTQSTADNKGMLTIYDLGF